MDNLTRDKLFSDLFLQKINQEQILGKLIYRNEKLCLGLIESIETLTLKILDNNKKISVNNRHIVKNKKQIVRNIEIIYDNNIKLKTINNKCSLLLEDLTIDMYQEFDTQNGILNSNQYYILHLTKMLSDNFVLLEDIKFCGTANKKIIKDTKQMLETVDFYVLDNYNLLQHLVMLLQDLEDLQKRVSSLKSILPTNIIEYLYDNDDVNNEYKEQFLGEIVHGKTYPLGLRNYVFKDLFDNTGNVLNKSYKFLISKHTGGLLSETEVLNEYIKSYITVTNKFEVRSLDGVIRGQLFDLRGYTRILELKHLKTYVWYLKLEEQKGYNLSALYNGPYNRDHIFDLKQDKQEEFLENQEELNNFRMFSESYQVYEKEELEEIAHMRRIRNNIRKDLKLLKEESENINKNELKEEQLRIYEEQLKQKKKRIKLNHIFGSKEEEEIYNQKVLKKQELDKQLEERIKDIREPFRIKKDSDRIYIFRGKEYPSLGQYKEDCLKRDKRERNYEFYLNGGLRELFREDRMKEEQVQMELLKKQEQIKYFNEYGPINEWTEGQGFIKNNNKNLVTTEIVNEYPNDISENYERDTFSGENSYLYGVNALENDKSFSDHFNDEIQNQIIDDNVKQNVISIAKVSDSKKELDITKYNIDYDKDKSRLYLDDFIRNHNFDNEISLTDKGQLELLDDGDDDEYNIYLDSSEVREGEHYNILEDRFFSIYNIKIDKLLDKKEFIQIKKELIKDVCNLLETREYYEHLNYKIKSWLK